MSNNVTSPQQDTARESSALEDLAARLDRERYVITFVAAPGRRPHLCITNREAAQLTENVYSDGRHFFWGWAERIGPVADVAASARAVGQVLRALGNDAR